MNWAVVEDGIVTNIIVADEAMAKKLGCFPTYAGIVIGEKYTTEIERVQLSVDKLREEVKTEIQADMAELLIDLAYRTTLLELGVSI